MEYGSASIIKGISINVISILGTIAVIQFLPNKKTPIPPKYNHSFKFYLITICLLGYTIKGTAYEDILEGATNGTFVSYLLLFFDATVGLALFLFMQKNIKFVVVAILLYVLLLTFAGSRSAIIFVLIIFICLSIFENNLKAKEKMRKIVLFLCIVSPIMFYYATNVRSSVDQSSVTKLLVGRISMVELASIPIDAINDKTMNYTLYDKKYGIINQLQQSFNEVSPLNLFELDVNPNQYHRPIFLGNDELSIIDKYMSMNMTLPTYFYVETNLFFGCILTILFLSLLYYFWVRNSDNIYLLVGIITQLYYMLQYFDWVMLVAGFYRIFLTIFALKCIEKFFNIISNWDFRLKVSS
ncbi:hypothetical protein [Flavobacterium sp. MDT1-60]|uniref:hypothetical protein n=1 Tax=Flavobacterium sp. MDT1-60 TaxID=1979344 RepID=UPI00177B5DE8|nr:hypothetical protein [Flavobacterium sp. MDT1-60]QOG03789.1 hypothetical protein IHE43_06055 [Flavobacterium sp. MDT1-60]